MTELEYYKQLEQRRSELTALTLAQKDEIAKLRREKKMKEATDLEKKREENLAELKRIMTELPVAKAAADKCSINSTASQPKDIKGQLDNEIVYVQGEYALVLCTDGTIAYTVQPEGTAEVGDLAFEADLKEFILLPEDVQSALISGYRSTRRVS